VRLEPASEARDVVAAVWLGHTGNLRGRLVGAAQPLQKALSKLMHDRKTPVGLIYGENNAPGATLAQNWLRPGKHAQSEARAVPGTNLTGQRLAAAEGTDKAILAFLEKVLKVRGFRGHAAKNFDGTAYIWVLPTGQVPAKIAGSLVPSVFPLGSFGFSTFR
jgi:hypothetical protein